MSRPVPSGIKDTRARLTIRRFVCSGSNHRKQELVKELQRNGVNFDVRKLNVGDFLWVAREKVAPVPGNHEHPDGRSWSNYLLVPT